MGLPPVYGHESLIRRLEGTIASGRFPQATLLSGSQGVGKQRIGLFVARALLCGEGEEGAACGACQSCRMVDELSHPDLHWFVPIPRPRSSDPDRQIEDVRAALAEVMAERRRASLYSPPDGMASHSLASARLVLRIASIKPFMGSRKVLLVGDAERLVSQEASPEAANALLKVLEEPPDGTYVIVTASEPQALLSTIRSRLVPIRVARVSDGAVREFLEREVRPAPKGDALEQRVLLAEGSIGAAVGINQGEMGHAAQEADRVLRAIGQGPRRWAAEALGQAPWEARGGFSGMLDALALRLRAELREHAEQRSAKLPAYVAAIKRVEDTRAAAQGNVNPQLALATLSRELAELL